MASDGREWLVKLDQPTALFTAITAILSENKGRSEFSYNPPPSEETKRYSTFELLTGKVFSIYNHGESLHTLDYSPSGAVLVVSNSLRRAVVPERSSVDNFVEKATPAMTDVAKSSGAIKIIEVSGEGLRYVNQVEVCYPIHNPQALGDNRIDKGVAVVSVRNLSLEGMALTAAVHLPPLVFASELELVVTDLCRFGADPLRSPPLLLRLLYSYVTQFYAPQLSK